jgi:TM2 domain-containing membrane protein YozV
MSSPLAGPAEIPPPLPPPDVPSQPPSGLPGAPPYGTTHLVKNPWLALVLSIFPGVGQIYNGQPAKAFVFFFAWVFSIYGTVEIAPLPFSLLIPFVYFYNLVDAYRSAMLINARSQGGELVSPENGFESPAWGGVLIGLGLILLLNNLGWFRLWAFQRYWPLLLIAAGGLFLYKALRRRKDTGRRTGSGYDRSL